MKSMRRPPLRTFVPVRLKANDSSRPQGRSEFPHVLPGSFFVVGQGVYVWLSDPSTTSLGTPPTTWRSTSVAQNLPAAWVLPTLVVHSDTKACPLRLKSWVNFLVAQAC